MRLDVFKRNHNSPSLGCEYIMEQEEKKLFLFWASCLSLLGCGNCKALELLLIPTGAPLGRAANTAPVRHV